jgi:hypothetical protein
LLPVESIPAPVNTKAMEHAAIVAEVDSLLHQVHRRESDTDVRAVIVWAVFAAALLALIAIAVYLTSRLA